MNSEKDGVTCCSNVIQKIDQLRCCKGIQSTGRLVKPKALLLDQK